MARNEHTGAATDPRVEEVRAALAAREPLSHREPRDAGREHFEAMLAPGMVHVGASGHVSTREQYLASTLQRYVDGAHGDDHTWVVSDFVVEHLAGDVWAARYVLHQGERVSRRLTVWERADGRWQARYHQGTVVSAG